jgi:hypothetical protein
MKTWEIAIGLLAASSIMARAPEPTILVCIENNDAPPISPWTLATAARMFGNIGVNLKIRHGLRSCPAGAIRISVTTQTPEDLNPGTLAYALPYEGTHIRVFYDRIAGRYPQDLVPRVLAYVFVHEITHIIQGDSGHSDRGVMKAYWDADDLLGRPLAFTPRDIDLIMRGLKRLAQRAGTK